MDDTRIIVVPDKSHFPGAAAPEVAAAIRTAVAERGVCSVALAGGNTPRAIHAALAETADIPWENVRFYFGDERCVSPDHPESNYRMASESLLQPLEIPPAHVFRMEAEAPDLDSSAARYADALPPRLDIVMLGMGPDGHTASLFPGFPALKDPRPCVPVGNSPKPPSWRLSLTAAPIESAREIFVFVYGEDKAPKVLEALSGPLNISAVPIQIARRGLWFLDEAAARLLDR